MTDKTKTIELKRRAHQGTINYLESKLLGLKTQLLINKTKIKCLEDDQRTYKKGIFALINLLRMQNGKEPFTWNDKKRKVIRKITPKNIIFYEYAVVTYGKNPPEFLGTFMKKENANKIKKAIMRIDKPDGPVKVHKVRIIPID